VPGSDKTVKVTLVAVASPYVKGTNEAASATTKLGKQIDDTSAKSKGLGSNLGGASAALKGMAVGAAAVAGTALVSFLRDSVKAAGDLEQSLGGVDAVFGKSAGQIHDFGQKAADSVGLSRNAFNELATVTGALLKNSGIKDFSSETLKLTQRAADVSATFGGTAKEAVEAFNSALKGEYNPIEKYGVKLNETAINAALAAKGLDKLKGSALEQAKAQERINLIMEQTNDHMGRFGDEANTLQGQQQRLTATWENAKAALGQSMLPVLTQATEAMRSGVSGVVAMASAWNNLPGPVQTSIVALTAMVALRGPLNGAIGGVVSMLGSARDVASSAGEAFGFARQAAERAGGGFKGAAAGMQTFTGGMGGVKLSAADAAVAVVGVAAAAVQLAQALQEVEQVDPAGLARDLDALGRGSGTAVDALGRMFNQGALGGDVTSASDALREFGISAGKALDQDWDGAAGRLMDFGVTSKNFADQTAQIDAQLAAMVNGGNLEGAKNAYERLTAATAQWAAETGRTVDMNELSGKFVQYKDALDQAAGGNTNLSGAALEAAAAAKQQQDAIDKAQKAVDKYVQSLVAAGMAVLSTRDAQRNLLDSLDAVNAQIEKNGTTLDGNTKAGRENQEALDGIARNALNLADAIYKETGSEEQMRASLASSRDSLIQTAIQFGMNKEDAQAYADSILKIPNSAHVEITSTASQVKGAVESLIEAVKRADGTVATVRTRYIREEYTVDGGRITSGGSTAFASGGHVRGPGTGTSDSVPAWLSNGEYVVKAAAVSKYGLNFLDRVNTMRLASGGPVGSRAGAVEADPHALASAVSAALDGSRLELTGVDRITGHMSARLVGAIGRV
jgi:hypothetical protein